MPMRPCLQKAKKATRIKRQKEAEKEAEQLGQEPVRKVPRTIENTREKDETTVQPDDQEVIADEQQDEFAGARCSKSMTLSMHAVHDAA